MAEFIKLSWYFFSLLHPPCVIRHPDDQWCCFQASIHCDGDRERCVDFHSEFRLLSWDLPTNGLSCCRFPPYGLNWKIYCKMLFLRI